MQYQGQLTREIYMKKNADFVAGRRQLLTSGCVAVAGAALLGFTGAATAESEPADGEPTKGKRAVIVEASREGICATCAYWGGLRRITQDGKSVLAESLGWCNNRESPSFLDMRSPEAGPMKAWRKWDAL